MNATPSPPPPASGGVRQNWADAPERVRSAVEARLDGKVLSADSQPTGFSPGVAARLRLADGRRFFVKAASPQPNPDTPIMHRQEGRVMQALPAGVAAPRLLWSYDEGQDGWVVLVFEEIQGRHPHQPWQAADLDRILSAMVKMAGALTPSPLYSPEVISASQAFETRIYGWRRLLEAPPDAVQRLDDWSARHLAELASLEAAASAASRGDTLQHFDIRADNILMTDEQVWFIDWPHARIGAGWLDAVLMAPSVEMQGGPAAEEVIAHYLPCRAAAPDSITAVVAALAGFFTYHERQPAPPGLPTLRAFQAAQGAAARAWLRQRTGWT